MIRKTVFLVAAACFFFTACSSDSEDLLQPTPTPGSTTCDTTNVTYASTITPLITRYACGNCHSGNAPTGGFTLTSYNGLKAKVTDGRLLGAITHANGFSPMPQGGNKMSECDINQFRAWINRGALNN
jgi:hypothetical protein